MENSEIYSAILAEKIKQRTLITVHLEDLNSNPLNPPERTASNNAFLTLKKNIREFGVIDVIHICGDTMTLINGHRRVESARVNGITELTAYRYDGLTEEERNILFTHLNTTSVKYSGSQKLHTYLTGGVVDKEFSDVCNTIRNIGDYNGHNNGANFLDIMRNRKTSPVSFLRGIREYCKVVNSDSMKTKYDVLDWMVNIGTAHRIKALISLKCPAHLLKKAINSKKPVMGTWEITAV